MATKKTAVIPEEEILAAATEENINEHSLHQTETEPEPDRVLSAEGAPGDADLIDICQTDSESANPEGMPIEDAARNTPEAPVSQTGSGTELPGEFPAGSDELTAPEAPASQTDSDLDEKKPEESPPARRTRKPRAKKSESDTAAAEPPGDASDGVEAPEKKPRRRAAARPASPVVSIDERPSVETEADKARNDLLDLVESLKTKRILTGTIQGIERPADHPSRSLAVIYHGDIKVIIPAEEAVEPPEDFRGRLPEDVLHYMVTKRLGAEVDYIIKGIDAKAGVAVGSRLEAMSAKRRAYYFGTDRDGNNLLYEGICAEARVVSVIRAGIFVDLFGLEVYIPLRELSYQINTDGKTYTVENEAGKGFINRALKGSLKIIKTTSDGKKEGFAFRITGANGYDMTFTTDAKGEIFIEKLRVGEYTVTELKNSASEGYKIADPVKITLVANETLTVKIHNDKTKVDVPKTGDDADLMLWISLLGLAAAGVGCTAFFYLKKRRTGKHVAVKK